MLVWPERVEAWPVREASAVTAASLQPVRDAEEGTQILLVGCGRAFMPPPEGLREAVREMGLSLEWMDTGAACRTFNVLLAEERPVAAALIAVSTP